MRFIDEVTISVASGKGGAGCVSFRRERRVPRGGPDGGDGGRGGDVIFRVNPQLSSLLDLKYRKKYKAGDGRPGSGSMMTGHSGENLVISIPQGTMVRNEHGDLTVDMVEPREYIFLKGGRGGRGNTFYKSSINQAPEKAQRGEAGKQAKISLELKLLSDVGLIGMPNAGKSTLISRISAAKPKIADYPFTTLVPNLGVVRYGDIRTYVVADIPGLVEGAHQGVGLGIRFLKHIERTRVFVHVIDGSEMAPLNPLEAYKTVNKELETYDRGHSIPLKERPQVVVINKSDVIDQVRRQELRKLFSHKIHFVSAITGENIEKMVYLIGQMVFGDDRE